MKPEEFRNVAGNILLEKVRRHLIIAHGEMYTGKIIGMLIDPELLPGPNELIALYDNDEELKIAIDECRRTLGEASQQHQAQIQQQGGPQA